MGGAYTVSKENLGVNGSLLAAAALMVDYVLNVAVGISAGVAALVFRNTKSARLHVAAVLGHSRFYEADDCRARSMPGGCLHCLLTRLWDAFCCCSLWVALTRFHLQVTRRLL
jgi:hypothetical protein